MIGFFEANRRGGDEQKKELIEFGSGLAELEDVYSTYTQRHWIMTGQSFLTLKDFFLILAFLHFVSCNHT